MWLFIVCLLSLCPCSHQKMALPLACVSLPFHIMAVALGRWFQRCASVLVLATRSLHPPTLTSERMGPVSCLLVHLARCRFMPVGQISLNLTRTVVERLKFHWDNSTFKCPYRQDNILGTFIMEQFTLESPEQWNQQVCTVYFSEKRSWAGTLY